MAERKPKPPIEEPKPSEPGVPTEAPVPKEILQRAKKIAENYRENNRGGAPITPEFVAAALQQGLNVKQIRAIMRSQALGGPQTSASYSSAELVDYFTANPTEIQALLGAVRSTAEAPANYAEYLAGGGEPGGYRAQNQLLQEGVLGIGGAREAYLAGTSRQQFINEGNDPNRWYTDGPEWMDQQNETAQANLRAANAGLAGVSDDDLQVLGGAAQSMLAARQARSAAQGDYFEYSDLIGQEE